jgi:hypothetical protein
MNLFLLFIRCSMNANGWAMDLVRDCPQDFYGDKLAKNDGLTFLLRPVATLNFSIGWRQFSIFHSQLALVLLRWEMRLSV